MRRLMRTLSERNQTPVVPVALMEDDARESLERENHALRAQLQASTTRLQSVETEKILLSTDNGRLRHELQTASKTIEDSKRLLKTLEQDYKKFVSTVLDQINSPIHVIDGSTAFLNRDLSTLRQALEHASLQSTSPNALPNLNAFSETIAQMKEHLNRLQESTQQQTEATRDMLIAFSRKTSSNIDTDSSSTPHTSPTEHAHMTPTSTPPLPRKLRVLAVDDQESILKITRKQLANTHTLETAINGEAAVAEWQKALDSHTPFDVIIMDVCMPGMGGLKATETIRQRELEQGILTLPQVAGLEIMR